MGNFESPSNGQRSAASGSGIAWIERERLVSIRVVKIALIPPVELECDVSRPAIVLSHRLH